MHHGISLIASAVSSLQELVGDVILRADPYSIMEMKTHMLQLHLDPELAVALREKGKRQFRLIHSRQEAVSTELMSLILSGKG